MKKILRNKFSQYLIAGLVYIYCLLVFYTSRVEFRNRELLEEYSHQNKPLILAFWHGRLLLSSFIGSAKHKKKTYVIISRHGDGALIAKISALLGVKAIRGSTNRVVQSGQGAKDRGGKFIIKESIDLLNAGNIIAYTPDGPKGPRMQVKKSSMLKVASMTGATILPISVCANKAKFFHSWDRFMLPYPFGKIIFIIDQPIMVESGADKKTLENTGKKLEDSLNNITKEVDKLMGIDFIDPELK